MERRSSETKRQRFQKVELEHMLADNCAMQLFKATKTIRCDLS